MIAPILAPWQDEPPLWIDGGDARRPVYRLAIPRPPLTQFRAHMPTPLSLACETVDVQGRHYRCEAIGFDGIVYGNETRVLRLLTLAAGAILFVAWCAGQAKYSEDVFWSKRLPLWLPKWEARIRRAMVRRGIEPPADLTARVEQFVRCDEDLLGVPLHMRQPERFATS